MMAKVKTYKGTSSKPERGESLKMAIFSVNKQDSIITIQNMILVNVNLNLPI